jgi:Fe-S cluster assembly protein SufD
MTLLSADVAESIHGPEWLRSARRAAVERMSEAKWPTSALEEWRYSRIDAFDPDRFSPALEPGVPGGDETIESLLSALGSNFIRVETVDGWVTSTRGEARILSGAGEGEIALGEISGEPDAFSTLNRAFGPDPIVVEVPSNTASAPVLVVHHCRTDDRAVFPRLLVRVGDGAQASVLEVVGGPARVLAVPVTELDVGRGANLSYLQVQTLSEQAWQIGLQASRVERDATLLSAAVALGGDYARLRTDSNLVGPGGSTRLLAMYFGAHHQMHDFRTVQGHRAEKTKSDLLYKGVVANQARSVYSGLIRVDKGARGTNAFQTNRNLVLHEGAHADSVPNLEIEENDVRCSHASAVGPVSEDQRFYLESRGVPPSVTDRLISLGFLGEVVEKLPFPSLAAPLSEALAAKFATAEAEEVEP